MTDDNDVAAVKKPVAAEKVMTKSQRVREFFNKHPDCEGKTYHVIAHELNVSYATVHKVARLCGMRRRAKYKYGDPTYGTVAERVRVALLDETLKFLPFAEIAKRVRCSLGTVQLQAGKMGLQRSSEAKMYLRREPTQTEWEVLQSWLAQKTQATIARERGVSRQAVLIALKGVARKLGFKLHYLHIATPRGKDTDVEVRYEGK